METHAKLKDGTEVVIREMTPGDVDLSLAFFDALPAGDKTYLRRPIENREAVVRRIQFMEAGRAMRVAALVDGQIVADGALELETRAWSEHIGEIRLIVAHEFQNKGLGRLMAFELYKLANRANIEEIIVKFMKPQAGVHKMFERLGFHKEAEMPGYVKDVTGKRQDLIVMRCNLKELWQTMEDQIHGSDWKRTR